MTPPGEQEVIIRAKNGKNDRREKKQGTTREKTGNHQRENRTKEK